MSEFMPYRSRKLFSPYPPYMIFHLYREGHIADEDFEAFVFDDTGEYAPTIHKEPIYKKMKEKTFKYIQAVGSMNTIEVEKKESELTENEIKLFYGDILRAYLSAPGKAQDMFLKHITDNILDKYNNAFLSSLSEKGIREHFNDIANGRD